MKNNEEILKELVIAEAHALKKAATLEELAKLDISRLDPESEFKCIYGQMTGWCFSDRAHDLIESCCERVYEPKDHKVIGGALNGKPYKVKNRERFEKYFSPIEVYIFDKNEVQIKPLVDFLKGETEVLELA